MSLQWISIAIFAAIGLYVFFVLVRATYPSESERAKNPFDKFQLLIAPAAMLLFVGLNTLGFWLLAYAVVAGLTPSVHEGYQISDQVLPPLDLMAAPEGICIIKSAGELGYADENNHGALTWHQSPAHYSFVQQKRADCVRRDHLETRRYAPGWELAAIFGPHDSRTERVEFLVPPGAVFSQRKK